MNGNPTIMPPTPMMNQQQQQPLSQQNGNGSNGGGPLNGTNGSNGLARPTQLMDELGGRDLEVGLRDSNLGELGSGCFVYFLS